jgi:hypothetical protein
MPDIFNRASIFSSEYLQMDPRLRPAGMTEKGEGGIGGDNKKMDHSEFMVLALQLYDVYRKSILGFASKKALAGERIAVVSPTLVST